MTPTLHPLNRSFQWNPPRGPYRCISTAQARAYDEVGFFVLEDAFDAATLRRTIAEIDPVEERVETLLRAQPGGRFFIAQADAITFTTHLVAHSAWLRGFCAGTVFSGLMHDLIGPDVRLYWDQAVYKKPAPEREFPWHQDNGYTYIEPQQYVTCWVALTDASVENGCPWVVPGLHRQGTLKHWMTDFGWACLDQPREAIPVPARAGSIVVFSSLTPHRTGPNGTTAVRKTYIVQFAPDGACKIERDAGTGELVSTPADARERQFKVLSGGQPVLREESTW